MGCVCALRAWTGPRCDRLRALALRVRQETHRVRREGRPPLVAGTKLFFADFYYGAIFSVATDGVGGAIRLVDGGRQPRWVAVDDVHVHWTNDQTGTVWLANKDGTGAKQIAVTTGVGQIVADGTNIYWVETFARRLMKAAKDGSGSTQVGPLLPSAGGGLAVDGAHLYVALDASSRGVGRVAYDGTGYAVLDVGPAGCCVAVDQTAVYVTGGNAVTKQCK